MANKLFMLSFISLIFLLNCLPSDDIWKLFNKVIHSELDYNKVNSVNYFFIQEKDYCKRDIESYDMDKLYNKQRAFFYSRKTSNYIFVVEKFDENLESLKDGAFHLSQYLYNEYKVKMENSVLAIFSIQTRRITIRTGEITKNNITDSEAASIISSLGDLLRQNNYYEAFLKYYDELDKYMVRNDHTLLVLFIILGLIALAIALAFIIPCIIEKCEQRKYLPNDSKLKDIVSFLKSQKANKKFFEKNCIICLSNLKINIEKNIKKEKNTEIIMEKEEFDNKPLIEKIEDSSNNLPIKEEDANTKLVEKEEEGISTLNCGHQFHTECIAKWLKRKNNCPICRQIVLNENKIVWNTQIELYPKYNHISYDSLYTKTFYVPPVHNISSNNYASNYNYCGGVNFGGGATGGW